MNLLKEESLSIATSILLFISGAWLAVIVFDQYYIGMLINA